MTHGVPHMHNVPYAYTYVVLKMHEHKLALFQLWRFYSCTYNKPEAPTGVLRSSPFTLIRSGIDISFHKSTARQHPVLAHLVTSNALLKNKVRCPAVCVTKPELFSGMVEMSLV